MIETYFINNDLGFITLHKYLAVNKEISLDSLGEVISVLDPIEGYETARMRVFLGNTKEEAEIKARNWFTCRKLNIFNLKDWYTRDILNKKRVFTTYKLRTEPCSGKYLVKEIRDYFGNLIIATVLEVLKLVDTEYGTIVIYKFTDKNTWYIETSFLHELEGDDYKFSDNEEYKDWVNEL